jgi:hypothetical protein
MRFLILRILTHSELGMFHEYRRQGKEGSKQRAINFDGYVVDRVFPAAKDHEQIALELLYDTDNGIQYAKQWLKRQEKNWRLEGNCPRDTRYGFVDPGCLFVMEIDAGTAPATGAWAVFPADDPVTQAVLADGESAGLASSAMIALHDEEGQQTWQTVSSARSDLFTAPRGTKAVTMTPAIGPNGVELPPDPARLVDILASVGHTMPSAVADLVDNSISANATRIEITFGRPDAGHGRWLSITDNGDGMDEAALVEAMRIGSAADYEPNSLGKYGYGLKGASWSQAKTFSVVTKKEGGKAHHLTWDRKDMDGWRAKSSPLAPWQVQATRLSGHGTVVLWEDMRPPQNATAVRGLDPHSAEIMQLERHLALVFHRFLEGKAKGRKVVAILINGNSVAPNNPVGHPLASRYDAKAIRVPAETQDGYAQVQAFLLPSEDEVSEYHKAEGPEAVRRALDLIGLHGKRNDTQGLFIYRHDRLIKCGGWHQMWETNDEKTKLARVVVDFDSVLDDNFKINISKQIVQLPQQLQVEIKKLADVARKDSQKKYRNETKKTRPSVAPAHPTGGAPGRFALSGGENGQPPTSPAGGSSCLTPPPTPPPAPLPRVAVRDVKTDRFVWKLSKGLMGGMDLQVSEVSPDLAALVKQIRADPQAMAHLAAFLGSLDTAEVQRSLLPEKTDR